MGVSDAYFSVISKYLRKHEVLTPTLYRDSLVNAFASVELRPKVEVIEYLYDVTTFYKDHINKNLKYFSDPHVFKFEVSTSGEVEVRYKMWAESPNWYPRVSMGTEESNTINPHPRLLESLHSPGRLTGRNGTECIIL